MDSDQETIHEAISEWSAILLRQGMKYSNLKNKDIWYSKTNNKWMLSAEHG